MAGNGTVELLNTVIYEDHTHHYSLNIIEKVNECGKRVRKFGIIERHLHVSSGNWVQSKLQRVYLPMVAFPRLSAFSDMVAHLATVDNNLHAMFKPSVPPSTPITTKHFETATDHTMDKQEDANLGETSSVVIAPRVKRIYRHRHRLGIFVKQSKPVEPSTCRKRGRPRKPQDGVVPKRAKKVTDEEHEVATQTTMDAPPVAMTTSEQ
jgi:hypothetical protein